MTLENSSALLFDDLRVEPAMFRAFKAGNTIQFEPKAFRLLLFLIENRGRLIEKDEILQVVWNGTHFSGGVVGGGLRWWVACSYA